jgi:UDP-N-acetylglucosamine:LPS N-acetylglucosamine transferase
MPFPEFEQDNKKVLFFSRGRGRGHAIPDIEIIRALCDLRPDVEVRIVSYGAGASTFADFNFPLIDIGLPDTSPIAEMSVIAGRLVGWLNPDIVVAHEEFPVMPAAKIFNKPAVFITDWFTDPDMYSMNALKFADEILFTGRQGVFDVPPWLHHKVRYIGPVLRDFRYTRADRQHARNAIGLASDAFVLSVFPGSWAEAEAPILELVIAAFDTLRIAHRKLIWLAAGDREPIQTHLAGREDVLVLERCWDIDRLMAATDVAITKMNRMTIFELHELMVPTIGLSFDLNPIDDQAVVGLEGVVRLPAKDLAPATLREAILDSYRTPITPRARATTANAGTCASLLSQALDRVCR